MGTVAPDGNWPVFVGSAWMAGILFEIARHLRSRHACRRVLQCARTEREDRWGKLLTETGRAWKMTSRDFRGALTDLRSGISVQLPHRMEDLLTYNSFGSAAFHRIQ